MSTPLIGNKYRISKKIGGGSFGEIFLGVGPNNEKVAIKFERIGVKCPQLRHEYKVYREIANCYGFCSVYYFGMQDAYSVMVMDLLGPSLEDLFTKCNRQLSLKTVLQIADQLLDRVDTLHSRHLIHRDIKPANFCVGVGEQGVNIYCVDFGLSKRFRNPKNMQHIPYREGRSLTGTPRYASVNNHIGIEQSRRDDLESIGYMLVYFLKSSLPWQGLKARNAQRKYSLILEKKQSVSISALCHGLPPQFAEYLTYCRSLKFDSKPDIAYLRRLFRDLYTQQRFSVSDRRWDWDLLDQSSASMSSSHVPTGNREVIDLVDSPVAPRTTRNSHHEVINLLDNDSVQVVLKEEEAWVVVAEDEEEAEVAEDVQMSSSAQKRRQTSQTMSASDGPAATVSSKIDRKSSAREGDPVHDSLIAATFKASREFVERNAMNGMDVVEDYVTDPSPARPTSCTRSHQRTLSATGGVKSFPIPPRQISTAGNQSSQSRPQVSATSIVRPSRFSPPVQILAAPPSNQVQTPTVTRSRSGNPSSAMAQSIDPPIGVNAPNTAATSNNNKLRATILTRSSTTMRR